MKGANLAGILRSERELRINDVILGNVYWKTCRHVPECIPREAIEVSIQLRLNRLRNQVREPQGVFNTKTTNAGAID